jgi:hypothetical protein
MSTSFIDEYLVKLGATVDQSGMARFHQALREASTAADVSASSIAGSFFKAQTEIVGGFVAIGTAALGLVDKVAMADQQYRLFALHMYMSKDAARSLKVAMDALGEPLENLTWDKELRDRTHQLIMDQRAMAPDGDFEGQMRKVRDIRFEFTRMEVELQYLSMHVVQDFMKGLGIGPDELLGKLQKFNDWVTQNMPQIANKIVTIFMPVWLDMKDVFKATGAAAEATGVAFTNLVGLLTGDTAIEGTTFDFEKFAKALTHIVHGFAVFAEAIANVEELLMHLVSALALVASGKFSEAGAELGAAFNAVTAKAVGGVIGGVAGGLVGSIAGPVGSGAGAMAGSAFGANVFDKAFGGGTSSVGKGSSDVHALIDQYAAQYGIDPSLAHAVAMHESGEHQFDRNGNPLKNPGSSATGVYQLINGTAKSLGVSSGDTAQNVQGGIKLLHMMLQRYHGNVAEAVGAYGEGAGVMDSVLAGKATLRPEARDNIAGVMRMMGKTGDYQIGNVTIHVTQRPGEDGKALAVRVKDQLSNMQGKQVQRNLAEFQDLSWSQ